MAEKATNNVQCECGSILLKKNLKRHLDSKKHKKFVIDTSTTTVSADRYEKYRRRNAIKVEYGVTPRQEKNWNHLNKNWARVDEESIEVDKLWDYIRYNIVADDFLEVKNAFDYFLKNYVEKYGDYAFQLEI